MNKKINDFMLLPIGSGYLLEDKQWLSINPPYIGGLKYLSLFSHAIIIYSDNKKEGLEKRQPIENSVDCLRNRTPTIAFLPILHHRLYIDPEQLRQAATICQGHLQGSQNHIP